MWLTVSHIAHMMPWKYHSVELRNHGLKNTWLLVKTFISFFWPENAITQVSWDPRPIRISHLQRLFVLLVAWIRNSSRVMRLLVDEYMVSVEHLYIILSASKSDSCLVVKSFTQSNWLTRHFRNIRNVILQGSWEPWIKDILLSFRKETRQDTRKERRQETRRDEKRDETREETRQEEKRDDC